MQRVDLSASEKTRVAAGALAGQGRYGEISRLARAHGLSRPTMYGAAEEAERVLEAHFAREEPSGPVVVVDDAQLERAVVALRAIAPNSIRDIVELLPILYPGVRLSYGTVQGIAAEAERRAEATNRAVVLEGVQAAALDEMFSQGQPVLAGIDLASQYVFALEVRETRTEADWATVLGAAKGCGLDPEVIVKDAAPGIAAGVSEVFPEAEQRDDCFHVHYEMGTARSRLERRALAKVAGEWNAQDALQELEARATPQQRETAQGRQNLALARWEAGQKVSVARKDAAQGLALHDQFEQLTRQASEAMEVVDLEKMALRSPVEMRAGIEDAAHGMLELPSRHACKVGRYVLNRAPGLVLYAEELTAQLRVPADRYGPERVALAAVLWRLRYELRTDRHPWHRSHYHRLLLATFAFLQHLTAPEQLGDLLAEVDAVFDRRFRASSAIEGFNAALRPYLYVHKGVSPGFLELFRAYHNLRRRDRGRLKGRSAHEALTGTRIDDWLTHLGYPPSTANARAVS
jgi:hypothetical protein